MMHSHNINICFRINFRDVLILVVMDDALALITEVLLAIVFIRLNPCCNG